MHELFTIQFNYRMEHSHMHFIRVHDEHIIFNKMAVWMIYSLDRAELLVLSTRTRQFVDSRDRSMTSKMTIAKHKSCDTCTVQAL